MPLQIPHQIQIASARSCSRIDPTTRGSYTAAHQPPHPTCSWSLVVDLDPVGVEDGARRRPGHPRRRRGRGDRVHGLRPLRRAPAPPGPAPPRRAPPGGRRPPPAPARVPRAPPARHLRLLPRLGRRVQAPAPRLRAGPAPPVPPAADLRRRRHAPCHGAGPQGRRGREAPGPRARRVRRHGRAACGDRAAVPARGADEPVRPPRALLRAHVPRAGARPGGGRGRGARDAGPGAGAAVRPALPLGVAAGLLGPAVEPLRAGAAPAVRVPPRARAPRRPRGGAGGLRRVRPDARGHVLVPHAAPAHGGGGGLLRAARGVRGSGGVVGRARAVATPAPRAGHAAHAGVRRRHGVLALLPAHHQARRRQAGDRRERGDGRVPAWRGGAGGRLRPVSLVRPLVGRWLAVAVCIWINKTPCWCYCICERKLKPNRPKSPGCRFGSGLYCFWHITLWRRAFPFGPLASQIAIANTTSYASPPCSDRIFRELRPVDEIEGERRPGQCRMSMRMDRGTGTRAAVVRRTKTPPRP
ncbi:hypothetical protein C2845_PM15G12080 [Panicum miliaceum]|uniref:Uncharacterized protein n=1 Tax=Panicum miliaceum TaxID=4540 RepID=A0A3L6Q6S9_PANMI|nr:hypothetical protein C2845_PM15G12080 [Panicum miliaceum]